MGIRIPTKILADRHQAGEAVDTMAEDYGCDRALIRTALDYEELAA